MSNLEIFLVEEGYCNTEREAIKILECISDEFYDFLVEKSSNIDDMKPSEIESRRNELSRQLSALRRSNLPPAELAQRSTQINAELKRLRDELKTHGNMGTYTPKRQDTPTVTRSDGSKSTLQTSGIGRTKTSDKREKETGSPMSGSILNVPRVRGELTKKATDLSGIPSEVHIQGTAQTTAQRKEDLYNRKTSGGGGTGQTRPGGPTPKG